MKGIIKLDAWRFHRFHSHADTCSSETVGSWRTGNRSVMKVLFCFEHVFFRSQLTTTNISQISRIENNNQKLQTPPWKPKDAKQSSMILHRIHLFLWSLEACACAFPMGSTAMGSRLGRCGIPKKNTLCTQDGLVKTPKLWKLWKLWKLRKLWKLWKLPNVQAVKAAAFAAFAAFTAFTAFTAFAAFAAFAAFTAFTAFTAFAAFAAFTAFKVLRNGLLRYILHTCPHLNVTGVQSATQWTASVHTSHMSAP